MRTTPSQTNSAGVQQNGKVAAAEVYDFSAHPAHITQDAAAARVVRVTVGAVLFTGEPIKGADMILDMCFQGKISFQI